MSHEHLYRDDVGAATERLAQLESENVQLRTELGHLTGQSPKAAAGRRSVAPYLMLITMTLAMLSSLAASGGHVRTHGVDLSSPISSPCRP